MPRAAWLASDPAGQDPVDGAKVRAAAARGLAGNGATRAEFKPFDPATKRAEAAYQEADGLHRAKAESDSKPVPRAELIVNISEVKRAQLVVNSPVV